MRTTWQSLIWKEWHEHKWKLASIVGILWGVTALAVLVPGRDRFGLAYGMLFLCTVPLAVFIGLGTAATERSRGMLPYLQSLPVPMWHVALIKLILGLVTLFVPVILTVVSLYAWRRIFDLLGVDYGEPFNMMGSGSGPIGLDNWYLDVAVFCAGIASSLFIWSAAAGVNRKDEVSAGAVALGVMMGWSALLGMVLWFVAPGTGDGEIITAADENAFSWLVAIALSMAPGGAAIFVSSSVLTNPQFAMAAWITAAVHLLLAGFYLRRFGKLAEREVVSPQVAVRARQRHDWLASPRSSPFAAIAWKQFRESGPIVLAGLALTVGVTLLLFAVNRQDTQLSHMYTVVSASLGCGTALVVGIGLVLNDLSPRLNTFWRSRPIHADLLFWTKFAIGLAIISAAIYLPVLFFAVWGEEASYDPDAKLVVPVLHIAVFAAGIAMTSFVRHAMYAAILSIAALYLGILTVLLTWLVAGLLGWVELRPVWWSPSETHQVVAGLLTTFVASTFVAWLAVRYDWGRKSRY